MSATNRIRWSDNDSYFGPFLYAPDKYRNFECILGSGDDEDYPGCRLRMSAFGHTLIVALPEIIKPWKIKVVVPEWRNDGMAERRGTLSRCCRVNCMNRPLGGIAMVMIAEKDRNGI